MYYTAADQCSRFKQYLCDSDVNEYIKCAVFVYMWRRSVLVSICFQFE